MISVETLRPVYPVMPVTPVMPLTTLEEAEERKEVLPTLLFIKDLEERGMLLRLRPLRALLLLRTLPAPAPPPAPPL